MHYEQLLFIPQEDFEIKWSENLIESVFELSLVVGTWDGE